MANFDFLKSKIRELHIPLPNFKYFHQPSSEDDVFENFIGREDISEKLETWLTNDDSGAYLITGYRGMGKSSFVGKVLNKITRQIKNNKDVQWFTAYCAIFIASITTSVFVLCNFNSYSVFGAFFFLLLIGLIWFSGRSIFCKLLFDKNKCKVEQNKLNGDIKKTADYEKNKTWFEKVLKIKNIKEDKHNLVIKLNLGHETLKEKDILSLIAKRIYDTYKGYLSDFYTNWIKIIFKTLILFLGAIFIVWFLDFIDITGFLPAPIPLDVNSNEELRDLHIKSSDIYTIFHKFVIGLVTNNSALLIVKIILVLVFYFLLRKLWNFTVYQIPFLYKHSTAAVLSQLKFLNDRIESAVTEHSGPIGGYTHATSLFSFNFNRRKNKTYPNASTREIEEELIQILQKIKIANSLLPWQKPPKFIIVFDELDKIDPVYNHIIKTEQDIPEFDTGAAFQGGSAMRDRKQNVLKLLGNMKLFLSSAKAKFVFISGRELYDAFLADLADREFAASSIFNGVIYVDSFLESSKKQKNIITKTEEYICGYLIPKEWYKKEAKKQYDQEKGEEDVRQKLDDITYRYPNLRMYKKFLIQTLINGYLNDELNIKSIKDADLKFATYKEFKNSDIGQIEKVKNKLSEIKQIFLYIDKVIVFLNQFSIYLTHVCNGSPKKITIYFEQYVKSFVYKNEKNPFSKNNDKSIQDSEYCLSFTATDQQKIGFINYMTYPIIQAIINNSNHFGDKMLVSVSFLIDHIFKHHKGGFSYENIDHTPELLEIYHIPHLRSLIDTILSFLKQNYIIDICGGVYQYKFRKTIADEILYNSRVSEEISAIFNFTLDESLPVKRYYYKQVQTNEKKYLALEEKIRTESIKNQYTVQNQYATILVSQLEILAEIHLFDEEHNEAIQHFQTAFEIIKAELRKCEKDKDKLHLYALLNRTALKLGLAKECKGYYNEAFVIYNTLLDYLTEFRDLKEKIALDLHYFYEDNLNLDANGEWKTKKTKIFHVDELKREYDLKEKFKGNFYINEVLPFYRQNKVIQKQWIDFLMDSDYVVSGLSKVLSPTKQEIISRLTLFSEIKSIFQAILANLFVVEKIDVNGITQENLDLAEDQFKYIYLFTDSKDKFLQAADFYKKLASILFLKNYSNPKKDEYLQMWGFDIYETINEFCFINSHKYGEMIAGKFPKEILKEFFIDKSENLWNTFTNTTLQHSKIKNLIRIRKYVSRNFENINDEDERKIRELVYDFIIFGIEKRKKHIHNRELQKCRECYKTCKERELNHPCYACNYVSKSLDIFIKVFEPKYDGLRNKEPKYSKRKSYLFKFLEYFEKNKTNNNYFFVLASALRIKADIGLSCTNEDGNKLSSIFLKEFFEFLDDYYNKKNNTATIDGFISHIENELSKLEKTILYYWLSAEYFYLNNSLTDGNESLTKILIIFDRYLAINEELCILKKKNRCDFKNPFKNTYIKDNKIFNLIQETIIKRILRNNNTTNDEVNHIELQNLKFILRNRANMPIILSNLSTTADIEDILYSYCKLQLASINPDKLAFIDPNKYEIADKEPVFFDCYKSTLSSQYRLLSTIQEKILSMEFKERMNMAIFRSIFENTGGKKELNFYDYDFQIKYFSFLEKYFDSDSNESLKIFKNLGINIDIGKSDTKDIDNKSNTKDYDVKIKALSFLINDSLFCLTQIIEILSSSKFSNYSHSFIGDIYHQISKWATLYRLTFAVLPKYYKENEMKIFEKLEIDTMQKRVEELTLYKVHLEVADSETREDKFREYMENISKKLENEKTTDRVFETNILNDIGTGNRHFLVPNYSVAMALKHYYKAIEINSEGKEYKEMIKKMCIIDDDISNGMHSFSLAIERYAMNCGIINYKIDILQKYYKGSLSYPLINYLKDTSRIQENDSN